MGKRQVSVSEQQFGALEEGRMVDVLHNGILQKVVKDRNAAFCYIHDHQGQSVEWAMKWERWTVRTHAEEKG